ncbi:MAG: hypothetical protein C4527_07285 [Candidatus Omnitrophota bacterium]|jgi:hypothetical protein|nr:MAG: hypothetical protein C4527_07285 [Candidatus Omnitrophota bacterium]
MKVFFPLKISVFFFLIVFCSYFASYADNAMQIITSDNTVSLGFHDKSILVYRYNDVPFKPYVQQFHTLKGVNVLRDAPYDHLHHHALMFAVSVNGVTFWEEGENAGSQIHQSFSNVQVGQSAEIDSARFMETLEWISPKTISLLREERSLELIPLIDVNVLLLIWQSRLTPSPDQTKITIAGNHYYGLGIRFPVTMDKIGQFTNAENTDGRIFRGEEQLLEANWCAYTVENENPLTICMFDHPTNYRPVTWFTMKTPFSYLSATLLYHEKPIELEYDQSLKLRYAVVIGDGILFHDYIYNLYKKWLTMPVWK